jgi:hypothetical protein
MTGVYRILHLPTNSVYIGQTSRAFEIRWNQHKSQLDSGLHKNWKLRELWNISDPEDFKFEEISTIPSIFTPLNAQILRALEEVYEIKRHKNDGFRVLNLTDGETVTTKKAWGEFIENRRKLEFARLRKTKDRRLDRTNRRRELESLKQNLQELRGRFFGKYESQIDKLQKILNRKSFFYKALGLAPNKNRQQSLLEEIKELEQKIEVRNTTEASLRDSLAAHGYTLKPYPTHSDVYELHRRIKKEAYYLRNRANELQVRSAPSDEIPLDLICPISTETLDAFDYLKSFDSDSVSKGDVGNPNLDKLQDSIITLYKAAIFEKAQGYLGLSILYREGLFLNKDTERAEVFFKKAIASSIGDMTMDEYWKHELILLHEKFLNCPMNSTTQIILLKELSLKGYAFAQFDLGLIYAEGLLAPKDLNAAFELYTKAATWGEPFAMYELGLMYLDGEPILENLDISFKWVLNAAKDGVSDAAFTLGWMYESGSGCNIDLIKAYTWYLIYSKTAFSSNIEEDLLRISSLLSPNEIEQAKANALEHNY